MSEPICVGDHRLVEDWFSAPASLNVPPGRMVYHEASYHDVIMITDCSEHQGMLYYGMLLSSMQRCVATGSWIEGHTLLLSRDQAEVRKRVIQ